MGIPESNKWILHRDNWTDSDYLFSPHGEQFCLDSPDDLDRLLKLLNTKEEKPSFDERFSPTKQPFGPKGRVY